MWDEVDGSERYGEEMVGPKLWYTGRLIEHLFTLSVISREVAEHLWWHA